MVAHTYNLKTWKDEAGQLPQVQGQHKTSLENTVRSCLNIHSPQHTWRIYILLFSD